MIKDEVRTRRHREYGHPCPLCDVRFVRGDEFRSHLGDAHGLYDDAGTHTEIEIEIEPAPEPAADGETADAGVPGAPEAPRSATRERGTARARRERGTPGGSRLRRMFPTLSRLAEPVPIPPVAAPPEPAATAPAALAPTPEPAAEVTAPPTATPALAEEVEAREAASVLDRLEAGLRRLEREPFAESPAPAPAPPEPAPVDATPAIVDATNPAIVDATNPAIVDASPPLATEAPPAPAPAPAADGDLGHLQDELRRLHLSGVLENLPGRLAEARAQHLDPAAFLEVLLADELDRRHGAALARRLNEARFETDASFDSFDFSFNPEIPEATIRDLASLRFLDAGESVILHGPVGVGKTHLAQAIGRVACLAGHRVRFLKTGSALGTLADRTSRSRPALLDRMVKGDLIILDDFGLQHLTVAEADALHEIITERGERGGVMLTSSRAPAGWPEIFPDPVVGAIVLDRLRNRSHEVFVPGRSYRPNLRPSDGDPTSPTA